MMSKVPPSCFCQRVSPFRFVATHSPVGLDSVPPNRLSMQDCCTEPSIPPSSVCSHTPSWFKDRFHENSPGVGLFCGEQRSHASSSWPDRSDAEFMASVHSPEVGFVASSGAVRICSSGFSSAGVSFLDSGVGVFFASVCVCVFLCGAAVSGLAVGVPHAVASRSNGMMLMAAMVLVLCMVDSCRWCCLPD